jgi:hypothetical protein
MFLERLKGAINSEWKSGIVTEEPLIFSIRKVDINEVLVERPNDDVHRLISENIGDAVP